MVGALNKVNTSLSSSISIPFHFHMSPPLLLYRPLHALLSNERSQDACTDGPAAACSPSGGCWHGRLFGPLPLPSSPVPTGAQKCIGVQTECRGAGAEPIWLLSCTVTSWHHWQQRERKIPHICHHTRVERKYSAHYCWLLPCVCLGRSGAEHKWVHCVLRKHMYAHLHPHSNQTQDWVTDEAFQLPTHSPASLCGTSLTESQLWAQQGHPFPNPFYWNSPVVSEWGHTDALAPVLHPTAPSM